MFTIRALRTATLWGGVFSCGLAAAGPLQRTESRAGETLFAQVSEDALPFEEEGLPRATDEEEIPPVIDRPLEVDEGPRIVVERFELRNAVDRSQLGIRIAELDALLEGIRLERPEGFTVGQLEQVAEEVTRYYRTRELILAQVVLPVQTVRDGVVTLEVLEGLLGRVLVEDNRIFRSEVLTAPFRRYIGQPVVASRIEMILLSLTDYPGLTVFGLFQPGQLIGRADLVLKVQQENRLDVSYRVDNQGTRDTGDNRFRAVIDWNNITGGADVMQLIFQQTFSPRNQFFWRSGYSRPLGRGFSMAGHAERNRFRVAGELDIASTTETGALSLSKSFIRSRQFNFSGQLSIARKDSFSTTRGEPTSLDRLTVASARLDSDFVDTRFGGLNFAFVEYSRGFNNLFGSMGDAASGERLAMRNLGPSRQSADGARAEGRFHKVRLGFTRLQTLAEHEALLLRTEFQWSPDLLVPLEQFSVGGPESVRSFPVAEILWDTAIFASLEYLVDAPFIADRPGLRNRTWGELLQVSAFFDYAAGELNDPLATDPQNFQSHYSVGVGIRFNLPGSLFIRLMQAWELDGYRRLEGQDTGDREAVRFWADITYSFDFL